MRFGDKAFIFSLDVIMAIVVVMSLLAVSVFYVTKAGSESVSKLQAIRIGSDVLAILDYEGTLDTLNVETIETDLNVLLPLNYHMRIRADCRGQDPLVIETTDEFPNDRFIGAGKRVFVTNTGKYCIASYRIWLK